jgi:lipopolysaccharide/colanic/teichoic acid biosynthesis glycosyltransferase
MKTKRGVDVVLGTLFALAALPLIVVLAIGCAIALRAWPIFVQRRIGKDGRTFPLPKLRTLPKTAPAAVDKYHLDPAKIPAFCRLLRRTHVDELPQLLVVPLGWMSLVGPRPEMPALMGRYPSDFAAARSQLRPGCTGLWQISSAAGGLIYEAPEYDVAYVHNAGPRLDAWVAYRTVRMWVTGSSGVVLADVPGWALRRGAPAPALPRPIDLRAGHALGAPVVDLTVADAPVTGAPVAPAAGTTSLTDPGGP